MKRPNGYWNDFQKLEEFLLPKCHKIGRMLTTRELKTHKGIAGAVIQHGGVKKVAEKLGFETSTNYKTLSGNIVRSIYEVIVDNFLYLNKIQYEYGDKIVKDKNYRYDFKVNDVFIEVCGYVGQTYEIQRRKKEKLYKKHKLTLVSLESELFKNINIGRINNELKDIMIRHNIKKASFYGKDLHKLCHFESYIKEKIISEIKTECVRNGFIIFPPREWWKKSKFRKKIKFLEGKISMYELANMCGLSSIEKPKKYWITFDNLKLELSPICNSLGRFPTQAELHNLGREDINNAIRKYHGGVYEVMKSFGFTPLTKPVGYWKNIENVKKDLLIICRQLGNFPTQQYLKSIGSNSLCDAISTYHGGFIRLRQEFGYKKQHPQVLLGL